MDRARARAIGVDAHATSQQTLTPPDERRETDVSPLEISTPEAERRQLTVLFCDVVVIGDMDTAGHHEQLALGEAPNIAARLQHLAAPNTIAISATTYRLVQDAFVCRALGARTLRGMAQPLLVYQVLQPRESQSRLEGVQSRSQTPLVGRDQALAFLLERWEQARTGSGQVVLISGEAGIGKSRLVKALQDCIAHEHHIMLEIRCSPFHQHSALYPIIDVLQRMLQLTQDEPPAWY